MHRDLIADGAAPDVSVASPDSHAADLLRRIVIGLIAFLTVVDLYATQAILPTLATSYRVSPSDMGLAVNSGTLGMALASLGMALVSGRLNRRRGVVVALLVLALPTAFLASAPNLTVFTGLRIVQGLCMASAFTLTLAWLGENCSARDLAGALAAYITGNVASNLFGRFLAAALVDHLGLATNFYVFSGLNLMGAGLAFVALAAARPMAAMPGPRAPILDAWRAHLGNPALLAAFAIGFAILFVFLGVFTFVNFVLVGPVHGLSMMSLGAVYFVFLPSILTTPLAGAVVSRWGVRRTIIAAFAVAGIGLPLLLVHRLPVVLAGLVLVGVGTFFAQATATGFVGRAARQERGAASGLYLASYFSGGLVGTIVIGRLFDGLGWTGAVVGVGLMLLLACIPVAWLQVDD